MNCHEPAPPNALDLIRQGSLDQAKSLGGTIQLGSYSERQDVLWVGVAKVHIRHDRKGGTAEFSSHDIDDRAIQVLFFGFRVISRSAEQQRGYALEHALHAIVSEAPSYLGDRRFLFRCFEKEYLPVPKLRFRLIPRALQNLESFNASAEQRSGMRSFALKPLPTSRRSFG